MPDSAFRPGSDEEWESLLRQVQQRPKPEPRPFFYARVHARILATAAPAKALLPPWLRLPAYAAVLGALVLAVSGDGSAAATVGPSHHTSLPAPQPVP